MEARQQEEYRARRKAVAKELLWDGLWKRQQETGSSDLVEFKLYS